MSKTALIVHNSKVSSKFLFAAVLVCLITLANPPGQSDNSGILLAPGEPFVGRLGSSPAILSFHLKSDEYFVISAQKSGTGTALSIFQPDGFVLRSYGCSHSGSLQISELASMTGRYLVLLHQCNQNQSPVSYEIQLSHPRAATPVDRDRVAAARLSFEAERLVAQYRADLRSEAILKYKKAQEKWNSIGDCAEESKALIGIAALYHDSGDSLQAFDHADKAYSLACSCQDAVSELGALLIQAKVELNQGDVFKAKELCTEALKIARLSSDRKSISSALYLRGLILYETADYIEAAIALEEAQDISESLGDNLGLARAVLYLSAIDFDTQRFDSAREKGQEALSLFLSLGEKQGQAMAMTFLGHFQSALGRKQEALNLYQEARLVAADSGDSYTEASLFNGIAAVHFDLGQTKTALQFLKLALEKNKALSDQIGIAHTLWSLGSYYYAAGDFDNALASLYQSRETFRSLSKKRMEGYVLGDIGIALEAVGKRADAMDHLNQSLKAARSIQDTRMEAWAHTDMGFIHEASGNIELALDSHRRALELYQASGNHLGKMNSIYRIAECLASIGQLQEALAMSRSALELSEEMRTNIANLGLRTSYFATMNRQYGLLIDLLMQLSHQRRETSAAVEAFETSERSRARILLESIAETKMSISQGAVPKQAERYATLQVLLDSKAERYAQLRSAKSDPQAIAELSDEIGRLTAEANMLQGQIRIQSPRYAALVLPEPLTLSQIQNTLLDDDSLLLEYVLGEERSYLWAVIRKEFASFILPGRSEIRRKVLRLREIMTARSALAGEEDYQLRVTAAEAEYPTVAAELSQMLLEPVQNLLGSRRLVFVADGALQYLPFRALPTPKTAGTQFPTPLLAKHEIVSLPSASTLAVIRREAPLRGNPDRMLAVFADPVFEADDIRVKKAARNVSSSAEKVAVNAPQNPETIVELTEPISRSGGPDSGSYLPRLLYSRKEAENILAFVDEDSRMAALGFQATRSAAMSSDLKRYRFVHFATHTILDDDYPDLSSLVMSLVDERGNPQNGHLRLRDVYNLDLSAELVVLSACDTALGTEIKGEGLISMVRGFMYSGAPRVLASLWKVDDQATAELMQEFYRQMLEHKKSPALALQQAQIAQFQKKSRKSPYYWAGFQLQGDWK